VFAGKEVGKPAKGKANGDGVDASNNGPANKNKTAYSCNKACFNGGECVLVQSTCGDANSPYDTSVCRCPEPQNGVCFWGQACQMKVVSCGAGVQSCNWVETVKRGQVAADLVCSASEDPTGICSIANVASQSDAEPAPSGTVSVGVLVAALLSLLVVAGIVIAFVLRNSQGEEVGDYGFNDGGDRRSSELQVGGAPPVPSPSTATSAASVAEQSMYEDVGEMEGEYLETEFAATTASDDTGKVSYLTPVPIGPVYDNTTAVGGVTNLHYECLEVPLGASVSPGGGNAEFC
jgi:hypothetical protein